MNRKLYKLEDLYTNLNPNQALEIPNLNELNNETILQKLKEFKENKTYNRLKENIIAIYKPIQDNLKSSEK